MSQAAVEAGIRPAGREINLTYAKEVLAGIKRQKLPELVLAARSTLDKIINRPFKPIFATDLSGDKAYPPSEEDIKYANRIYAEDVLSGRKWEPNRAWRMAGLLAGGAATAVACSPAQAVEVTPVSPTKPAEATAAPGVGGGPDQPIPTFVAGSSYADLNSIIDRFNNPDTRGSVSQEDLNKVNVAKAAETQATATAEAQKPLPPEVDVKVPCNILPDQFCNLGFPITRKGRNNQILGIRFTNVPPGTLVSSIFPGELSVGTDKQGLANLVLINSEDPQVTSFGINGDLTEVPDRTTTLGGGKTMGKVGPSGTFDVYFSSYNPSLRKTLTPAELQAFYERFFAAQARKPVQEVSASPGGVLITSPKYNN